MPQVQIFTHLVTDLKPGDLGCFIYDTDEEHRNITTPSLRKGLDQDDKVFSELSEKSIICKDMTVTADGAGNSKQDEIISGVKNL